MKTTYLLFRSDNRQGYALVSSEGLAPPDSCRFGLKDEGSRDPAAFTQLLDERHCGGSAVTSFAGWNVRFIQGMNGNPDVRGMVESPGAVYIVSHSTTGGMPGGAVDELSFAVVFPRTDKRIDGCGTVTDLGPYDGPMPP